MKSTLRTVAVSAALVALTMGTALAQDSKPAATTAPAKTEAKPKPAKAAHVSMTKDQYKAAQEALAKGGYYKGKATGTWDKASASALKAWEKANKMPESGHLTPEVLTKLTS